MRTRARALLSSAAIAALLGASAYAVWGSLDRDDAPAPPCPFGFADLPGRTQSLLDRLASTPEGASLVRAAAPRSLRYCYGPIAAPSIADQRVLLLDPANDERASASRLGHLLSHAIAGSPLASTDSAADCDRIVEHALRAEAAAYALELRLRRELRANDEPYPFEHAYWSAPPTAREETIFDYLLAHPDGGHRIDALGAGYRARCERGAR